MATPACGFTRGIRDAKGRADSFDGIGHATSGWLRIVLVEYPATCGTNPAVSIQIVTGSWHQAGEYRTLESHVACSRFIAVLTHPKSFDSRGAPDRTTLSIFRRQASVKRQAPAKRWRRRPFAPPDRVPPFSSPSRSSPPADQTHDPAMRLAAIVDLPPRSRCAGRTHGIERGVVAVGANTQGHLEAFRGESVGTTCGGAGRVETGDTCRPAGRSNGTLPVVHARQDVG